MMNSVKVNEHVGKAPVKENINMKNTTVYTELNINNIGDGFDRHYKNPLTKAFRAEYALYLAASKLFESVRCRSMCIDSLKLYFGELPHTKATDKLLAGENEVEDSRKKGKTQEDLISEMETLVNRDVAGHVNFPMMNICAAEVRVMPNGDGTHTFFFTDGIYGFRVSLKLDRNGKVTGINTEDLSEEESKPRDIPANTKLETVSGSKNDPEIAA